jgi:hypothetical protein
MNGQRTPANPPAPARGGPPGAGGPPGSGEAPYTHSFFDQDEGTKRARKAFISATAGNTVSLILVIWAIFVSYLRYGTTMWRVFGVDGGSARRRFTGDQHGRAGRERITFTGGSWYVLVVRTSTGI